MPGPARFDMFKHPMKPLLPCVRFWAALFVARTGFTSSHGAEAAATGTITGSVSNAATTNLLEGSRVEIGALGLSTLADNTGRYVLTGVPAGTHEVVVSYLGLDTLRRPVTVGAGERAVQNFDLTTSIYRLEGFKVSGEREGGAAAITAQRNAPNLKNVAAMDSFGNLPNMSASEVAINLPGVAAVPNESGLVTAFTVRGMGPGLNTVTMDGVLLTSRDDGLGRATQINVYASAMFDQIELTKGHTPDRSPDSLGGTINLKSRSPLGMKEKRRITYNVSGRMQPTFTQQVPLIDGHRSHPLVNLGYQEIFDVFVGERNLGVAVNLFYSEHATAWFITNRDFQNTTNTPAYVWDYRTTDTYNPHYQASANVKLEYRLSPTTKLTLNTFAVDNNEKFRRRYETRAFTNQIVGTTGTAGILPGYTDRITQVRATPNSLIDLTMTGPNNVFVRARGFDLGAEQTFGPLQLDYKAAANRSNVNRGNGKGAVLINRISNVGWILDRTQSDLHPRFIQTEGPDITNPANYRPAPNGLTNANADNDRAVQELHFNARYTLPVSALKADLKTGAQWRENSGTDHNRGRRWNYIGTTALPADTSLRMYDERKTGRRIPQWEASTFINERVPVTPSLWNEDRYFFEQNRYIGSSDVSEKVTSAYLMTDAKLGRTGLVAGLRTEKTETESSGYVRARAGSTPAQQVADPVGSAQRDYAGNRRELSGRYTKSLPSVHVTQNLTPSLKARLSWSTGFGRPPLSNLRPNETANDAAQTLTISNPSLLPQTASNWDATLDYYFEPVGNFSVSWFHKSIRDYIVSGINTGTVGTGANNGFNGEYGGYTRLTTANAGTATVQGWELSYQQQFTFLPGLLKGFRVGGNYTSIETAGDFGGTVSRSTNEVPGFIPRTGNVNASWHYRGFSVRYAINYTGDYITSFTAASVGRNLYRLKRTITNLGLAYQVRPALTLTCDVSNLYNNPEVFYRGVRDQMASTNIPGTAITLGVNGRF